MHRLAVVGRGLIGGAAARHLAESNDGVVCIGPDEPENRETHGGVFASHYDEGRMTRHVDPMAEWGHTAARSIARYRDLEARSGIDFYSPVGYLGLGGPGSQYNDACAAIGALNGAAIERLSAAEIRQRYPYLAVEDDTDGLVEAGGAGHISPRRLVKAQTLLAEQAGALCIRQAARRISPTTKGAEIELWDGTSVLAERVLIAAGAFTAPLGLSARDLGLTTYGRTTVLVRIEREAADILKDMPTMIDTGLGAYILPPIGYPDGHSYLKIGVGDTTDPAFDTLGDLQDWFKGPGLEANRRDFTQRLKELFPILETCAHWATDTCAVTATRTKLPVIDWVDKSRIAVAVGGNGKGAKGSDEWGRIAAGLLSGAPWSSEIDPQKLTVPQ